MPAALGRALAELEAHLLRRLLLELAVVVEQPHR
jgi:hypothetical protein